MARDLVLARQIVETVMEQVMTDELLGNYLVPVRAYTTALEEAVSEVADLLDPNELDDAFDDADTGD